MTALARARDWFVAPPAPGASRPGAEPLVAGVPVAAAAAGVTSAAVLGRPGEVEPVAAALALALRREARAKAAAVAVVGAVPADVRRGGNAAARRLAARFEAYGLEAHVRGRLAWVALEPGAPHLAAAARRVSLVAAPVVLAVASPRSAASDEALGEHDLLVVVTDDREGPLARLASAGLPPIPTVSVAPLSRGPVRALVRAGMCPGRSVGHLLATAREQSR
jgi:hypothetical protein